MTWRCLIAEATTGLVVDDLRPLGEPGWDTEINNKGSWSVDLVLGEAPNFTSSVLSYVTSGRYVWVIVHDNTPLQGGLPTGAQFEQATRTFSVSGSGIGSVFENRVVRTPNATPATIVNSANNYTLTGITQRRVIRELFSRSVADTASGGGLPFDLTDAAAETGSVTRTYSGWELTSVWGRAQDESDMDDGPEFIIRPYFFYSSNQLYVGWKLAIGTPLLGDQNLNAVWELGSAFGQIDVDYNMAIPIPHRAWAKGSGDSASAIVGHAENTAALQAAHIPYADYVDTSHSDVGVKATLDIYAAAELARNSVALESWTASVRVDGKNTAGVQISPALGSWVEGDAPLLRVTGHPVIPDNSYRRRITGMSNGREPGTVNLKIKPTPLA